MAVALIPIRIFEEVVPVLIETLLTSITLDNGLGMISISAVVGLRKVISNSFACLKYLRDKEGRLTQGLKLLVHHHLA